MRLITTSYVNNRKDTTVREFELCADKGAAMNVVNLYPNIEYQTFLGFGGAITEAAGYAYSKLSKKNQEQVAELYFGPEGNRYGLIRTHIDSCDFSLNNYEAMSDPGDTAMESFTLERDEKYILPLLRAGQEKKRGSL